MTEDNLPDDLHEELENLDPDGDMDVTEQDLVLGRAGKGRPSKRCEECGEDVTGYVQDIDSGRVVCFDCSDDIPLNNMDNEVLSRQNWVHDEETDQFVLRETERSMPPFIPDIKFDQTPPEPDDFDKI